MYVYFCCWLSAFGNFVVGCWLLTLSCFRVLCLICKILVMYDMWCLIGLHCACVWLCLIVFGCVVFRLQVYLVWCEKISNFVSVCLLYVDIHDYIFKLILIEPEPARWILLDGIARKWNIHEPVRDVESIVVRQRCDEEIVFLHNSCRLASRDTIGDPTEQRHRWCRWRATLWHRSCYDGSLLGCSRTHSSRLPADRNATYAGDSRTQTAASLRRRQALSLGRPLS